MNVCSRLPGCLAVRAANTFALLVNQFLSHHEASVRRATISCIRLIMIYMDLLYMLRFPKNYTALNH